MPKQNAAINLNMSPIYSGDDVADLSWRNTILFCQFCFRFIFSILSYFQNIFFGKLAHAMCDSFRRSISTFSFHIGNVFCSSSKKKMFWINTDRVVALMTNSHPIWNWPIVYFPRYSMGLLRLMVFYVKPSITINKFRSAPNPTFFSFLDSIKEIIRRVHWHHNKIWIT